MASIVSINLSSAKGTFKYPTSVGYLIPDFGIEGDAHADNWHRQVSLLGQESIDKMTALGAPDLTPGKFAENITTEGIELYALPVGTKMKLGECLVEVTQIGKKCHHHCEIYKKVGKCVMPLEGIFVKVITGGHIHPGDAITILSKDA